MGLSPAIAQAQWGFQEEQKTLFDGIVEQLLPLTLQIVSS